MVVDVSNMFVEKWPCTSVCAGAVHQSIGATLDDFHTELLDKVLVEMVGSCPGVLHEHLPVEVDDALVQLFSRHVSWEALGNSFMTHGVLVCAQDFSS